MRGATSLWDNLMISKTDTATDKQTEIKAEGNHKNLH